MPQTPAVVVALVLLALFACSVVFVLQGGALGVTTQGEGRETRWPLWLAVSLLSLAGVGSAPISSLRQASGGGSE